MASIAKTRNKCKISIKIFKIMWGYLRVWMDNATLIYTAQLMAWSTTMSSRDNEFYNENTFFSLFFPRETTLQSSPYRPHKRLWSIACMIYTNGQNTALERKKTGVSLFWTCFLISINMHICDTLSPYCTKGLLEFPLWRSAFTLCVVTSW
jgi:hypothetical protein